MKLYEYQGKALFAKYNIPTPKGVVITSTAEIGEKLGGVKFPAVVKAQILAGGRGKAGGIKFVDTAAEAGNYVLEMLNTILKDLSIDAVYVEEKVASAAEYYLSITMDSESRKPIVIFSKFGGMDIEEIARNNPDAIVKVLIDPQYGLKNFHVNNIVKQADITEPEIIKSLQQILPALYKMFIEYDAMLVEINPLMVLQDNTLIAADAKVEIDDVALFRHKDLLEWREAMPVDPLVKEARDAGFLYIDIDTEGTAGVISNGSGMLMSCIDWISREGGKVACVLDLGGGATSDRVAEAIKILLKDARVKSLLISIFGGITRCDEIAGGIKKAIAESETSVPIVTRLEGTNKEKGLEILSTLENEKIMVATGLKDAAEKVLKAQKA
jgi:succinyl-CoA synthetase beta subunit